MSELLRQTGLAALDFARRMTLGLLEGIPEDKYLYQPFEGANHVQWIAAHLAWTDDYFLAELSGRPAKLPETWSKYCGYGSELTTDSANFPGVGEIKDRLGSLREEFRDYFKGLPDEKLEAPLPNNWKDFAPNYAGMMSAAACHESMHAGQLTVIRRALGLPRVFG